MENKLLFHKWKPKIIAIITLFALFKLWRSNVINWARHNLWGPTDGQGRSLDQGQGKNRANEHDINFERLVAKLNLGSSEASEARRLNLVIVPFAFVFFPAEFGARDLRAFLSWYFLSKIYTKKFVGCYSVADIPLWLALLEWQRTL